jgi:hypothetical protein
MENNSPTSSNPNSSSSNHSDSGNDTDSISSLAPDNLTPQGEVNHALREAVKYDRNLSDL